MMSAYVIKMIQHEKTQLTQRYMRGKIGNEEFLSGMLVYQERDIYKISQYNQLQTRL